MTQIFIFGSSSAYGVGAEKGGWGDLIKQYLHSKMYGENGVGEKYEVFNFARAGDKISFVQESFRGYLGKHGRVGKKIALVNIGGNNMKAENEPDNYVSTIEEYREQIKALLKDLKNEFDHVIFVEGGWVDESKTNPKSSPLTDEKSYFTNARRREFGNARREICDELGVNTVDLDISVEQWKEKYLFEDGLHPNQAGYELIFEKIKEKIDPLL